MAGRETNGEVERRGKKAAPGEELRRRVAGHHVPQGSAGMRRSSLAREPRRPEAVPARAQAASGAHRRDHLDKRDGRIDNEFFDRKADEFRAGQGRLMRNMQAYQSANQSYIEEDIRVSELAQRAHKLFEIQSLSDQRELLEFCTFEVHLEPRGRGSGNGDFDGWRGVVDTFRTLVVSGGWAAALSNSLSS